MSCATTSSTTKTNTRDAREKALQALRDAELHRINPAQCYEDVAKARVALAGGRKVGNGNKDHEN
jgi:hypothetical protein